MRGQCVVGKGGGYERKRRKKKKSLIGAGRGDHLHPIKRRLLCSLLEGGKIVAWRGSNAELKKGVKKIRKGKEREGRGS